MMKRNTERRVEVTDRAAVWSGGCDSLLADKAHICIHFVIHVVSSNSFLFRLYHRRM